MLLKPLLQASLFTVLRLSKPTNAADVAANAQQPIADGQIRVEGMQPMPGVLVGDCDASITACGTTAEMKIIRVPGKTVYVTSNNTFEDLKTLPTVTSTTTIHEYTTVTTSTEGACQNTTYITDTNREVTVTVQLNITTTRDFVPVVFTGKTETITVNEKATEQCIVMNPINFFPAPTNPSIANPVEPAPPGGPSLQPPGGVPDDSKKAEPPKGADDTES